MREPPFEDTPRTAKPKRKRRLLRFLGFLSFLAIVVAAAITAFPHIKWIISDEELIAIERAERLALATAGLSLPGAPDTTRLDARLAEQGMREGAPVLIRIFKKEFELELWMKRDGVFKRFVTYPICRWSGTLGPKLKEGDGQAPEGFYSVDAKALNPNSQYYRSFNVGYPNAFDASLGRTGSLIMVHGACASIGCFAMTNTQMGEIWRLVTAALSGGQRRFQVQIYPFRLGGDVLKSYADHPNYAFWSALKAGNDLFEANLLPPRVSVCEQTYRFSPSGVYPNGDGGIENACRENSDKS